MLREELRRAKVHLDANRRLKLDLKLGDVEQAGFRRRIDEEVEVAVFGIFTVDDGAEERGFAMPESNTIRRMASRCCGKTSEGLIRMIYRGFRGAPGL